MSTKDQARALREHYRALRICWACRGPLEPGRTADICLACLDDVKSHRSTHRRYACSHCGEAGHNVLTCAQRHRSPTP